jgi:outer membrane protein assembly factor BamB
MLIGCTSRAEIATVDTATSGEAVVTPTAADGDTLAQAVPATAIGVASIAESAVKPSTTDWPTFRGPTGQGVSNARGLPLEWSADKNLAWKTALPGPGASSAVVFGDRIYITCYSGYFVPGEDGGSREDLKRHLVALNRADGKIVWDRPVKAKLPEEERIRDHGFAASTPAVDADRIYVFFGKTGVLAFDHDGEELWRTDVGERTHGWGSGTSPVLYKDMVIVNASVESDSLVALDRKTGDKKWTAGGIRESWNTPVIIKSDSGRTELIVARQGNVLAFNPDNGEQLWSCETDIGWYMVPSVVAADGIVYCLGGRSGTAGLAVRDGGSGDVTDDRRLWTSQKGSNVTSPVLHDGHLYWAHEQQGIAFCAKGATGQVVYEQRLPRAGQVYSSSLLADGRVYHFTREGKTFVLAAKPEFELLATSDLNDGSLFNGSPAVDGKRLLIRSDKFLYCVGE